MPDPASPPVWLTLPDGQEVRGRLLSRRWTPSGWRYRITVALWSATNDLNIEPADYVVWIPAGTGTHVRPVDGADYTDVPTEGPPSHPYLAPPPQPADMEWAWTGEQLRFDGPRSRLVGTCVHEYGCPIAPADGPELDLGQALIALARDGAHACQECSAAEVLTRL
ncbi:DUF6233 domain-containing protein (plasmid) [Streptomyces sp. NBC_00161]|uniref:DUF6233 domain-containing protein n=1 Tax=Streptomyces sp. NBC_00161 TaxID=2975671 RepID=UPI002F91A7EE